MPTSRINVLSSTDASQWVDTMVDRQRPLVINAYQILTACVKLLNFSQRFQF